LPAQAKLLLSLGLWGFVALDVIFLVLPNFIKSPTINEANPFAANQPAAQATTAPAMAKTTEAAIVNPTGAAMVKTTEAAMTKTAGAAQTTVAATVAPVKTTEAANRPFSGDLKGQTGHEATGKALLGKTPDGKAVLRLENFNISNAPDLLVYLVKEADPTSNAQVLKGVELGALKATQGSLTSISR
jgi:hypothetical protein